MVSSRLVAAVGQIKADGARRSPADVLAQLQRSPEWADVTLSQVRRAISAAPKAEAEIVAARREEKKAEHEAQRDRTKRARPAEEHVQQQRREQQEKQQADELAARRANAVPWSRLAFALGPHYDACKDVSEYAPQPRNLLDGPCTMCGGPVRYASRTTTAPAARLACAQCASCAHG